MTAITVHHSPAACSRVTLVALEEAGIAYADRGIALLRGDQRAPAYLALNPKGKVPVLVVDDVVLTETPVILGHLARAYPDAGLLPPTGTALDDARLMSDLVWIAGALHPVLHRILRAAAYSTIDEAGVRNAATVQLRGFAETVSHRVGDGWWSGDHWSITDTYLAWVFATAERYDFALADFPAVVAHRSRVEARPAFAKAVDRERAAVMRDTLPLPPGLVL